MANDFTAFTNQTAARLDPDRDVNLHPIVARLRDAVLFVIPAVELVLEGPLVLKRGHSLDRVLRAIDPLRVVN